MSKKKVYYDLDWFEEISHYVAINKYKVVKVKKDKEYFSYYIIDAYGDVVLTIESKRDLRFIKHRKRGKRKNRS